jgi:predicted DNA-binding transcriptional regulator AlpA
LTGPQLKSQVSATPDRKVAGPKQKLLFRKELCAFFQISAPTLWHWQLKYNFPRPLLVAGKNAWLAREVDQWIASRPRRRLKGDTE